MYSMYISPLEQGCVINFHEIYDTPGMDVRLLMLWR